jgi:hypothetical protein
MLRENAEKYLDKNLSKHMLCNGDFSQPDLLLYLLKNPETKATHVTITTFSIAEEGVRALYYAIQEYGITIDLIIDHSAKANKKVLVDFANMAGCNIYFAQNHSKIMLLENDKMKGWGLFVISSGNFSDAHRWETTVIVEEYDIKSEFKKQFNLLKETAEKYEPEQGATG